MPELPEVRVSSKMINKNIKGQVINDVVVLKEKLIKEISKRKFIHILKGKEILNVTNYGKFLVFHLSDNLIMLSHLRMEGSYHVVGGEPLKHDRIIFKFKDFDLAYNDSRMFGTFHLRTNQNYKNTLPLSKLAKEPQDMDVKKLQAKLQNKRIAIKSSLLDQTVLNGLGNIYVNEVLFHVHINPQRPSNQITLSELKKILRSSAKIMDKSTSMGGTTIKSYVSFNDQAGGYQDHLKVHGKTREKCPRCKRTIAKIKVGGRGTYYCPHCQK
ncbi:bifunctional DNA-formamidopyrimidine glycosylase/DNA-(apurinic or apyrimidinic site) lyase [Candidatus Mycoplasma mahonii]|uniref:bifunctional DNA-formamidopyrimidine glycosylase/DNA-(apurinic or apyrimidinic site) lyase n=1 Tax=Candidatus Mycoplasma mahonii TaxID=3004105 RepID=UPI0026F01535|nr:bifunctional DNA-formamidopyrimidine glycosylase/DNA-(apurinic or apyrimidinic site) lyase [Candidatus Mycoplasma mahonii]WKX02168.1 bifunctional DNA-formamidopyrimidine glycosylase/DNA-(apurinic or apyrimidinic site) lyase [Candidatus Mycoplasma mahonii]